MCRYELRTSGFRKLSSDRHTDKTKIIHHATLWVINNIIYSTIYDVLVVNISIMYTYQSATWPLVPGEHKKVAVSYTHLTLPTIYSV